MALLAVVLTLVIGAVGWAFMANAQINRRFPADGTMAALPLGPVHYRAGGDLSKQSGTPLLLVHGAASNSRELPAALGHRLDGFPWIAPDRTGLGHTPRIADGHRLGVQAALMAQMVEHAFPGRKVIAVGHSWGSAVSLRLALDRPDLVAGLVLLAPASHPWGGPPSVENKLATVPVLGFILSWLLPPLFGPLLAPQGIAKGFAPGPVQPVNYGEVIGTPLYFRPHSFRANAADMVAADGELAAQASRYAELSMPVTVISGQGDKIVFNSIHAKGLVQDIPQAVSHTVPNAGHMPHWVDPDLVLAEIKRIAASN
jgi:pimeloyl-ACP methyl ester carboxylesterase